MARPMKPLVKSGGYYPSNRWTPLVYRGGYTTANGVGEQPDPVEKTASGAIVHITDALAAPVSALSIAINPAQDLHGYDNPWPAGGGKNLYDASIITGQGLAGNNGVVCTVSNGVINLNGTATSNAYFSVDGLHLPSGNYAISTNNPIGANGVHIALRDENGNYYSDSGLSQANYKKFVSSRDISAVIIYVKQGTQLTNFKLQPQVEVGTATTSWTPYSNICPISGWTGANVTRTGKNLLNKLAEESSQVGGITFVKDGHGSIEISGTAISTYPQTPLQSQSGGINKAIVPTGATVTLSVISDNVPSGGRIYAVWYERKTANTKTNEYTHSTIGTGKVTFTTVEPYANLIIVAERNGVTYTNTKAYVQLEYGDAATAFEPSNADTYSITFPASAGTVYGGTLDVTTGKLTVDRAMVDLGDLSWARNTGVSSQIARYYFVGLANVVKKTSNAEVANALCEIYKIASANDGYIGREINCVTIDSSGYISCYPSEEYADEPTFRTAMSGVQFVYELATPIVYDLTPTEVKTLLGENNIWADTGDVTVTYLADGNASDAETLGILLGGRYTPSDDVTDKEALGIILGGTE